MVVFNQNYNSARLEGALFNTNSLKLSNGFPTCKLLNYVFVRLVLSYGNRSSFNNHSNPVLIWLFECSM